MCKYIVSGGNKIEGKLNIRGAKNSILPIMAATILNENKSIIHNVPNISDVYIMIKILESIGCKVDYEPDTLIIDSSNINSGEIDEEYVRQMRSSIIIMGAMIGRLNYTKISYPGGCAIGSRPIDLHLKALKKLGIKIEEKNGYIKCFKDNLKSATINLEFPSVGATENAILAAIKAKGITKIYNAAREPEIVDLENFLNKMGAKISGAGNDVIRIDGEKRLYGVEHTIIPDRIAGATYLLAGAITSGNIILRNTNPQHMGAIINALKEMGCKIYSEKNRVILTVAGKRLKSAGKLQTMPYPGFPTDIQSPFMALASVSEGTGIFVENIFENRYQHVEELVRMGADIQVDARVAVVCGVERLSGAKVVAKELRGGAALVLAGLAAEGITEVENIKYIDRGYEDLEKYLGVCGANIRREE